MGCNAIFPVPLPDNPKTWDGWNKYKSPNFYERLCLDHRENPNNEVIEEHCRELLRWWQKKLPLKNQPNNPLAQILRSGLDESSRFLMQARVELLNPEKRQRIDEELAAREHEQAVAEFQKFFAFAIADGYLTAEEEKSLFRFGAEQRLTEEEVSEFIEAGLKESGAKRPEPPPPVEPAAASLSGALGGEILTPREDFLRMLRLSNLDNDAMTDDQRDAFINMAESLGLEPADAEDLVDLYLDQVEGQPPTPNMNAPQPALGNGSAPQPLIAYVSAPRQAQPEEMRPAAFMNSLGGTMRLVPSGSFVMGSDASDAGPKESPLTKTSLSRFYMSQHPITNKQYEEFDKSHVRKRAPATGDRHPVVHVSSLDAIRFCDWLSAQERRKYRLPTEAEWEYAARGTDGRRFPWGNDEGRGDRANFADRNAAFVWSDRAIDDGYPESSPVGAFPRGASPFGMEDMAGNVWEWCLDNFEPYRGTPRINPRSVAPATNRVYRGGSWKSRFNSLRATARGSNARNYSCNDLGFRIVCECE